VFNLEENKNQRSKTFLFWIKGWSVKIKQYVLKNYITFKKIIYLKNSELELYNGEWYNE